MSAFFALPNCIFACSVQCSVLITFMIVIAGIHLLVNDLLIEEGIIPRIPSRQEFDLYFDREEDKTSSAEAAEM